MAKVWGSVIQFCGVPVDKTPQGLLFPFLPDWRSTRKDMGCTTVNNGRPRPKPLNWAACSHEQNTVCFCFLPGNRSKLDVLPRFVLGLKGQSLSSGSSESLSMYAVDMQFSRVL